MFEGARDKITAQANGGVCGEPSQVSRENGLVRDLGYAKFFFPAGHGSFSSAAYPWVTDFIELPIEPPT